MGFETPVLRNLDYTKILAEVRDEVQKLVQQIQNHPYWTQASAIEREYLSNPDLAQITITGNFLSNAPIYDIAPIGEPANIEEAKNYVKLESFPTLAGFLRGEFKDAFEKILGLTIRLNSTDQDDKPHSSLKIDFHQ